MKWQPIETAPKDGTIVLVFAEIATVEVVHLAWFNSEEEWERSGKFFASAGQTKDDWVGWWSYTRECVTQEKLDEWRTPTHWTPYTSPSEA